MLKAISPKRWLLFLSLAVVVGMIAYGGFLSRVRIDGWSKYQPMSATEGVAEAEIKRSFLTDSATAEARYDALFMYFLSGAMTYASPSAARIQYPGAPSGYGYRINGLEGFARTGTLLAAWIASGRGDTVSELKTGRQLDLVDFLRRGILAGTDPAGADYWGPMHDSDQRIVESADIARILWLTRDRIWNKFDDGTKRRVADWLLQLDRVKTPSNNWLLFPVTVGLVLKSLGYPPNGKTIADYDRFKSYYASNGWFVDKPHGIDYYNAWGVAYEMLWISRIDPGFDASFIGQTLRDSADLTAHLISPAGVPIMGRSSCYRTAVPVPVIAESFFEPDGNAAGLARRALDAIWRHFVAKGSLQDGTLTQGYYRSDLSVLDRYSGPGSCNWGLRSLVLAFLHPRGDEFWTAPEVPLPVERADYHLELDKLGWIVDGKQATGEITITIPKNTATRVPVEPYGIGTRLLEQLVQRPLRPQNDAAKYRSRQYSSKRPFTEE